MAIGDWWTDAPGLRGIFPSILQAASEHQTTAQVWQTIRDSADTASAATLSITLGREPTGLEIADASALMLKGVNIQTVNHARAVAGEMVAAHSNLTVAGMYDQIDASMIATPPWSQTANAAGISTQYRIHVQRDITVRGFTAINRQEWASYNLTGPITSVADALAQANALFRAARYNSNVDINGILDYTIEAI